MDWLIYVIIGVIITIGVIFAAYYMSKVLKLNDEQRKELIVNFLVGLVTAAEMAFDEHGKGSEKLAQVEEEFNKNAPWFLKLLLQITGSDNLEMLIEAALEKAKGAWTK